MHVRSGLCDFAKGWRTEGLPVFVVFCDQISAGIFREICVIFVVIYFCNKAPGRRDPRVFLMVWVLLDMQCMELVVREIHSIMALYAFALAGEYFISLYRIDGKRRFVSFQIPVDRSINRHERSFK